MAGRHTSTTWLHLIAIAVVTFVAYSDSFHGGFVSDDKVSVVQKESIRSLDREHLVKIFTTFDDSNFIPVKVLTIAIDYHFWGLNPVGYHITNLVIHIACAFVVYLLLLRLDLPPPAALLTSLLWAVHPVQVESVAWISERKNVLSGLFFFAAFLAYIRFSARPSFWGYLGTFALLALALLSKMNTMVLPALCLAYEWTMCHRLRWRDVAAVIPMLLLGAAVAYFNLAGNPIHGTAWHGGSVIVSWLSSFVVFFRYLGKIALPLDLRSGYDVPLRGSLLDPPVLAATIGLVVLAGLTLWLLRQRRREAFWMLWFAICLAPMLNILVPFRAMMQDRFLHLALLGPLALVATVTVRLASARVSRLVGAGAIAAVAICTMLSYQQVKTWRNPLELWKPLALHYPLYAGHRPGAYRHPDHEERVAFLERELARDPLAPIINNNLATTVYTAGDAARALPLYERAARQAPDRPAILANLANTYIYNQRGNEALPFAARAATLAPHMFVTQFTLLRAALFSGDVAQARQALTACERIRSDARSAMAWQNEKAYLERLEAEQRTRNAS